MSEELKPCPLCRDIELVALENDGFYHVVCGNCGIDTGSHGGKDAVIKAWNNRPIEDKLQSRIKYLEEHNKLYLGQIVSLQAMVAEDK